MIVDVITEKCRIPIKINLKKIPVNFATFADEETWFELIGTAGRTFSFVHAADGFAEAVGTELCKGKRLVDGADVEETAHVVLAVKHQLAM